MAEDQPESVQVVRGKSAGLAVEIAGLQKKKRTVSEERLLQQLLRIQAGEEVDFSDEPRIKPSVDWEGRRRAILEMLAEKPMYCKYIAERLRCSPPTALRCLEHEWFRQDATNDNRWELSEHGQKEVSLDSRESC